MQLYCLYVYNYIVAILIFHVAILKMSISVINLLLNVLVNVPDISLVFQDLPSPLLAFWNESCQSRNVAGAVRTSTFHWDLYLSISSRNPARISKQSYRVYQMRSWHSFAFIFNYDERIYIPVKECYFHGVKYPREVRVFAVLEEWCQ